MTAGAEHDPWPAVPTWSLVAAVAGGLGVMLYVGAWAVAGVLTPGYDPLRQAISELFALGAPDLAQGLVSGALTLTGLLLAACGPALHRGLPGKGATGPVLVTVSGLATLGVVAFPCSAGCPGYGTSLTDSLHTITAGAAYLTLVVAPVVFGLRLRGLAPWFARASLLLGTIAVVGFVLRYGGVVPVLGGLQQRIMNTVADAWYVLAALEVARRWRLTRSPAGAPAPDA